VEGRGGNKGHCRGGAEQRQAGGFHKSN
jgi:hypothetical protein